MRTVLYTVILILLVSCTKPKTYFRALQKEETAAIKKYSGTVTDKSAYHVLIMTDLGDMVVKLYNETPKHRDNFVEKVKAGFYDSLMFHRVINNFMIQGGDPNSKKAVAGAPLGSGSAPGERIPAEFLTDKGIYHKRGALAAARDNNPQKASSNCQFYIVHHKPWRTGELDSAIVQRGLRLTDEQRKIYTTIGGTPHLDGTYTVYGELVTGFDVLDKIAETKTMKGDRPEKDVRMRMFLLNEPEAKK
jgi:cyclophilin family peptidyl-prolyl cis-trans isomerase